MGMAFEGTDMPLNIKRKENFHIVCETSLAFITKFWKFIPEYSESFVPVRLRDRHLLSLFPPPPLTLPVLPANVIESLQKTVDKMRRTVQKAQIIFGRSAVKNNF